MLPLIKISFLFVRLRRCRRRFFCLFVVRLSVPQLLENNFTFRMVRSVDAYVLLANKSFRNCSGNIFVSAQCTPNARPQSSMPHEFHIHREMPRERTTKTNPWIMNSLWISCHFGFPLLSTTTRVCRCSSVPRGSVALQQYRTHAADRKYAIIAP